VDWHAQAVSSSARAKPDEEDPTPVVTTKHEPPVVWLFRCSNEEVTKDFCRDGRELGIATTDSTSVYSDYAKIGEGSFAEVFVAFNCLSDDYAAVKVAKSGAADRMLASRDVVEIDILRRLNHPNVLAFQGLFVTNGCFAIATDFVSGGTLQAAVVSGGPMEESLLSFVAAQLLDALVYLHSRHIVHRDLKPENILLEQQDGEVDGLQVPPVHVVIADFGLASYEWDLPGMAMACGSPGYIAPEVILRHPYGCPADVFSAGALLYVAGYARDAFRGTDAVEVLQDTLRCAVNFRHPNGSHLGSHLRSMLRQCLLPNPEQRLTAAAARSHRFFSETVQLDPAEPGELGSGVFATMPPRGRSSRRKRSAVLLMSEYMAGGSGCAPEVAAPTRPPCRGDAPEWTGTEFSEPHVEVDTKYEEKSGVPELRGSNISNASVGSQALRVMRGGVASRPTANGLVKIDANMINEVDEELARADCQGQPTGDTWLAPAAPPNAPAALPAVSEQGAGGREAACAAGFANVVPADDNRMFGKSGKRDCQQGKSRMSPRTVAPAP